MVYTPIILVVTPNQVGPTVPTNHYDPKTPCKLAKFRIITTLLKPHVLRGRYCYSAVSTIQSPLDLLDYKPDLSKSRYLPC